MDSHFDSTVATPLDPVIVESRVPLRERAIAELRGTEAAQAANNARRHEEHMEYEAVELIRCIFEDLGTQVPRDKLCLMAVEQRGSEAGAYDDEVWVAKIDGLWFAVAHGWRAQTGLVRPCDRCSTVIVEEFDHLADLGALLEQQPNHRYCPALRRQASDTPLPPPEPTVEQRVMQALKDLIRQEAST